MTLLEKYYVYFETIRLIHHRNIPRYYSSNAVTFKPKNKNCILEVTQFLSEFIALAVEKKIISYLSSDIQTQFVHEFSVQCYIKSNGIPVIIDNSDDTCDFRFVKFKTANLLYKYLKYYAKENHFLNTASQYDSDLGTDVYTFSISF